MVIRKTGPAGLQHTPAIEETATKPTQSPKADFAARVSDAQRTPTSAVAQTPITQAVSDVAAQVRSGTIPRDGAADAVIERYITATAAAGTPSADTRERVQVARAALGDDPVFMMRLERMLTRELE